MYDIPHLDLPPLVGAAGTVRLPGSKSISNRVLLLAGLCEGSTTVHDLLDSDDTQVMLAALQALGCGLQRDGTQLRITGLGGRLAVNQAQLFLGNAGTAMRPLTAALAVLVATQGGDITLSGVPRMHERPIGDLVDALRQLGCDVACTGQEGYPPLRLTGRPDGIVNTAQPVRVRGDVSSQFLTALLLALPLVAQNAPVVIEVQGELISKPYIEITLNLLARFGIAVQRDGWSRFTLPAGSRYRSPGSIHVEGDASSASYFVAIGAIAATDQPVRIEGVGLDSIQGDIRFLDAAKAMGAHIEGGPGWVEVKRGAWPLKAISLDCNHIPDAAMTLAAMALYADGPVHLTGIASWRVKETDRIAAMAAELRKVGATVVEGAGLHHRHGASAGRLARRRHPHLRRPPHGHVPVAGRLQPAGAHGRPGLAHAGAGAHPRPALRGQDLPRLLRGPVRRGAGRRGRHPGDHHRRPHRVRQGHAGVQRGGTPGLAPAGLRPAVPRHRAGRAARRREPTATKPAWPSVAARPGNFASTAKPCGWPRAAGDEDVALALRQEAVGAMASKISALPAVRQALHTLQLAFRQAPGLVADGRDMGTVIFPDARLKVFLTASAAMRAERRLKQLISKGIPANIDSLRADLEARDARDRNRSIAPLKAAPGALELDNSAHSVDQSVQLVLDWWAQRQRFD